MQPMRTFSLLGILAVCVLLFAACGSSSSATSSATPTTSPSPTSNPTPTPTASTSTAPVVKTASATVNGAAKTILTNAQGLTLYYFTPDGTDTTSHCTGGCAATWPALLVAGSNSPTSATTLPGTLTAVANANGTQVQYNKHFLYTYTGDSAPGQMNGEGIGNSWFVATTDLS